MWLKKLQKNPTFHDDYKILIHDIVVKGYAQRVPNHQRATGYEGKKWFIPHHGIYHPQKQGKICVVFDCSAKPKGNSLNDQLMKDPDLTNSLLGVLSRFQQECIAVMADIKAIFHQVKIPNYNCLFLCFLYWPDGDLSYALAEYQMTLHLFGAVSSPACANFALRKMVDDNEQHFPCDMKNTVRHNFYVEECLKSLLSVTVAIIHVHELCSLLYCGDFRSTK